MLATLESLRPQGEDDSGVVIIQGHSHGHDEAWQNLFDTIVWFQ